MHGRCLLIALSLFAVAVFAGEPKEYKKGTLDHWEVHTGSVSCSSHPTLLLGASAHCSNPGVRVYHVVTEDGFDYTVQPDIWDPFKSMALGQEIQYRIDSKGQFWTPDPMNGTCPWPCTGEQRKNYKQNGNSRHEAKYFVALVERRKTDSTPKLTNKDIVDMSRVGLSETVIVAKINASQADFDLGIEALSLLKQNGVSDAVVAAMLQRASH